MMATDIITIFHWWILLLLVGVSVLPAANKLFPTFFDKGYILSKVLSIAVLSYLCFFFGTIHLFPFTLLSLLLYLMGMTVVSYGAFFSTLKKVLSKRFFIIAIFEECFFFLIMAFWVLVRGFNPEVHGLEKYMDFGFMNSILRSEYFPPRDMWMTPYSINYYYFGHFYSAVLTRLSGIPSHYTYNLLLGMVAGLCFITSFSLAASLLTPVLTRFKTIKHILGGLLSAFLITFAGNLHTIYTLFKPYENEHPVPPWQLAFSPSTFPNSYWYPNATRFIYNTIHEFPIYSWVVSDLHGHVLDIPFVLFTISLLYSFFSRHLSLPKQPASHTMKESLIQKYLRLSPMNFSYLILVGFFLAVMYMTNAWDGLIYLLLTGLVILYLNGCTLFAKKKLSVSLVVNHFFEKDVFLSIAIAGVVTFISFLLFSLPFSLFFKPFVSGIGILCAPSFLTKIGHLGPFLFEPNHCQKSPWWQLLILYGFFYFFVVSLLIFLRNKKKTTSDIYIFLLIILATILIIVPEFIYAKDIYPAHYRANTMFKLVFQSFMMLSLVSGYTLVRIVATSKWLHARSKSILIYPLWIITSLILLTAVFSYPYFAITSYYNNLTTYQGIDGTNYLRTLYPSDFAAITWLNQHIKGQPVILEAQSDSYTDYGRVSTDTGLPTVLGWTVHEWLWRGEYDYPEGDPKRSTDKTPYYPAPRITDVQTLYESPDLAITKQLIKKYNIQYVFLGDLERQKYPNLDESKWNSLGKVVFRNNQTEIYKLNR